MVINLNINVSILDGKATEKIWKAVGALFPVLIRRQGRALNEVRAERIKLIAQAKKDEEDIRAGKKTLICNSRGEFVAMPVDTASVPGYLPSVAVEPSTSYPAQTGLPTTQDVFQQAAANITMREVQRFINLHQSILYAEEQGGKIPDEEVSENQIDGDWINRWRECAQDATDEYMQRLWGRILADEVKSPGTYRMRTLDFLRTLDKQDALKISALGPYVLDLSWVHKQDEAFVAGKGPTFDDLLELQDMGIIAGVGAELRRQFSSVSKGKFANIHSCGSKALALERESPDPPYVLPYYRLTALGREVMRLGDYVADDEYLKRLGRELKRQGFRVKCGDWIRKPQADSTWGRVSLEAEEL